MATIYSCLVYCPQLINLSISGLQGVALCPIENKKLRDNCTKERNTILTLQIENKKFGLFHMKVTCSLKTKVTENKLHSATNSMLTYKLPKVSLLFFF